ncbi:MAG: DUF3791 domain-containing protein [Lachnospiraceae bacterium]|nr:DUF3791 domain-containing protein [Lachnospiraceae bacterium]
MEGKTEFVVFCIENIAIRLNMDASEVYRALTEQSDILYSYIIPNYEVLHTQGKDYIVDDIIDVMREDGISV